MGSVTGAWGEWWGWARPRLAAAGRGLVIGLLSFAGGLPLLIFSTISLSWVLLFGVGIVLAPPVLIAVRGLANERRQLAGHWSGVQIPPPYRVRPEVAPVGLGGAWQRFRWLVTDPATWRDLLWLLAAPVNLALGVIPGLLLIYAVEGVLVVPVLGAFFPWYGFGVGWFVRLPAGNLLAIPQGLLCLVAGLALGPPMLRLNTAFARLLLGPTRSAELALRVRRLAESRAETVDAQAAELRRIERDLHDGAQARLVALGMSLGLAEDLFATRPDDARKLLAEAREASGLALADLRGLVRGIHPPVLAERGLDGGLRAVALALPLGVRVDIDLPGRLPAPVESAAYFAVAEALANVVKHSGADHAWLEVRHANGRLAMTVGDDGRGGADPGRGSGLAGIRRRLAAFDGTLHLNSPPGGPTIVTMELPCELSSPRTSSSCETG